MDPFYVDFDFDSTDLDDTSSSVLPFDFIDCSKPQMSPTHVAMFYPQLGYDLHPLLINQHKHESDVLDNESIFSTDDMQTQNLLIDLPKTKEKRMSKYTKKRVGSLALGVSTTQSTLLGLTTDTGEKNRKIFFCRECGKSFKFQTSLLRHNNKVHNCKYQCPTCHRVFSRQAYLDVHISKPGSSCFLNCFTSSRMPK